MQPLKTKLSDALAAANALRNDPNINKKWLNKITARLEELVIFADQIGPRGRIEAASVPTESTQSNCSCPPGITGAYDRSCPVHGRA